MELDGQETSLPIRIALDPVGQADRVPLRCGQDDPVGDDAFCIGPQVKMLTARPLHRLPHDLAPQHITITIHHHGRLTLLTLIVNQ
nr:hypothetical protein GCM10025732_02620 [Glycomyces mayteni]